MVMNYLLESKTEDTDSTLNLRLRSLMVDITDLMGKFGEAAEILIADSLLTLGWSAKIREQ